MEAAIAVGVHPSVIRDGPVYERNHILAYLRTKRLAEYDRDVRKARSAESARRWREKGNGKY